MAWVYILQGTRYYVGSTSDLQRRLKQHTDGHTPTTKRIGEWRLVWKRSFGELKEARVCELSIKKWKSSKMIERLIHGEVILSDRMDV